MLLCNEIGVLTAMTTEINRRNFLAATGAGIAAPMAFTVAANKDHDTIHSEIHEKEPAMNQESLAARITLVQMSANADMPPPIERMPAFFEQAADVGADLVVFPEYILGHKITPKDDVAIRFFELAKKHHINAIVGCVEQHGADAWATSAWVRSFLELARSFWASTWS